MIQVPVIFSVFPREVPATLFGTNKIASVVGTSNAAFRYIRSVKMPWGATLVVAAIHALLGLAEAQEVLQKVSA